jgi:hypothetical protein
MIEMNEETSDLYDEVMNEFQKKGGFQKLLKDLPGGPVALDLNTYLPTFKDLAKMDLRVEYIVPGALPKNAITNLNARGGGLKTWLALELGACVSEGRPFVGLPTEKTLVYYIDYENSLPMLVDRTKIIGPSEMKLWHISNSIPPPRLDSSEWILFKALLPGLIIFDTLRSCQLLDENSSKDMSLVMGRLKELRELGHTILLLHHTTKNDPRTYRGSTAILDLCDHVLGLERVKEIGSDQTIDNDEADLPLRLGTREKTRFEPFSMYLTFDPSKGFRAALNPEIDILEQMRQYLLVYFKDYNSPTKTQFIDLIKIEMSLGRGKILKLIEKGNGDYWTSLVDKIRKNKMSFTPVFYEGE